MIAPPCGDIDGGQDMRSTEAPRLLDPLLDACVVDSADSNDGDTPLPLAHCPTHRATPLLEIVGQTKRRPRSSWNRYPP